MAVSVQASEGGTPKMSRLASSPFYQADQKSPSPATRSFSAVGKASFIPAGPAPTLARTSPSARNFSAVGKASFLARDSSPLNTPPIVNSVMSSNNKANVDSSTPKTATVGNAPMENAVKDPQSAGKGLNAPDEVMLCSPTSETGSTVNPSSKTETPADSPLSPRKGPDRPVLTKSSSFRTPPPRLAARPNDLGKSPSSPVQPSSNSSLNQEICSSLSSTAGHQSIDFALPASSCSCSSSSASTTTNGSQSSIVSPVSTSTPIEAIDDSSNTIAPTLTSQPRNSTAENSNLVAPAVEDSDEDLELDGLELPLPPAPTAPIRKVVLQGWLHQSASESTFMGRHLDMWKKRWVVFSEDGISWFNSEEDCGPGKPAVGEEKINGPFELISESDVLFSLTVGGHTMRFKAMTVDSKHEWAAAFEEVREKQLQMNADFRDIEEKRAMQLAKILLPTLEAPPPVKVFKEGWLLKQGGGTATHTLVAFARSQWKKRWIVLNSSGFSYFENNKGTERELGFVPFDNNFAFTEGKDAMFTFQSNSRVIPLKAENPGARNEWLSAMSAAKSDFALKRPETQEKQEFGVVAIKAIDQPKEEKLLDKNCIREGYLTKKGDTRRTLKSRYFVLTPGELRYYKHPKDLKPIGIITIHDKAVVQASKEEAFAFFLVPVPGGRQFALSAKDSQDQVNWLEAFKISVPTMTVVKGIASPLLACSAGRNFLQVTQRSTRSIKEGFMLKQGHLNKNWKRRYFVLEPTLLEYFKNPHDKHIKGVVTLGSDGDFATVETDVQFTLGVNSPKKLTLVLCCETPVDLLAWLAAFQQIKNLTVNTHTGGKRSQRVVKSQSAYSLESAMAPSKVGLRRAQDI